VPWDVIILQGPEAIKFRLKFRRLIVQDYKILIVFRGRVRVQLKLPVTHVRPIDDQELVMQDAAAAAALDVDRNPRLASVTRAQPAVPPPGFYHEPRNFDAPACERSPAPPRSLCPSARRSPHRGWSGTHGIQEINT